MQYVAPIGIGILYALLMSLVREPHRRCLNAVMVAGAGAAYLSGGGLGGWEFAFTALLTYVAFRGLESWTWIGVGWLLHTVWDVVHHIKGNPIIPFAHTSSLGCAICDPVIALWCLRGGPSLVEWARNRRGSGRTGPGAASGEDPGRDEAGRGGTAGAASPTLG
ncbi:DUF6010 family protein [Streptomyces sp. enrichment culture]|uniref:DUF6010 family protein n=1 Tax=Streptomyces sp. enrichment culture TaxID=1795815 RepID=UPI003F54F99A